jgi:hypothetical protein
LNQLVEALFWLEAAHRPKRQLVSTDCAIPSEVASVNTIGDYFDTFRVPGKVPRTVLSNCVRYCNNPDAGAPEQPSVNRALRAIPPARRSKPLASIMYVYHNGNPQSRGDPGGERRRRPQMCVKDRSTCFHRKVLQPVSTAKHAFEVPEAASIIKEFLHWGSEQRQSIGTHAHHAKQRLDVVALHADQICSHAFSPSKA